MAIIANKLIKEINISKQARALQFLRFTDYPLVYICGFCLVTIVFTLFSETSITGWGELIFILIMIAVLSLSVYMGYRHLGVINPHLWRTYLIILPLLIIFCGLLVSLLLFYVFTNIRQFLSNEELMSSYFTFIVFLLWIVESAVVGIICVLLLKNMRITALGIKLSELIPDYSGRKSKLGFRGKKRRNVKLGILNGLLGIAIILGYLLIPMKTLGVTYFLILFFLGWFMLVRARRYFQPTVDSLLSADKRKPILFLRSFEDDQVQSFIRSVKNLLDFSLETRLSNYFNQFGPFISIGSPRESVPQIGAARAILSETEWQSKVNEWISEASLIVMYIGKTYWINWEIIKVLEKKRALDLILLVPEVRRSRFDQITSRFECVKQVFKQTIWSESFLKIEQVHDVRAMLLRADGSVVVVRSRPRNRDSYHLAALVAHYIMLNQPASTDKILTNYLPTNSPRFAQFNQEPAQIVIPVWNTFNDVRVNIPNRLILAIISTVVCCGPLGIIAIIYASQVEVRIAGGDIDGAGKASRLARLLSHVNIGLGVVLHIAIIVFD